MKGFKVTGGDVSVTNNRIDMVEDTELEKCTMEAVLGTRRGEDVFDGTEGIDFYQILGKGVTEDMVRTQITSGVNQVNSDYVIEDFEYSADRQARTSTAAFTARKSTGETVSVTTDYS